MPESLLDALAGWMPAQRWYADKGRPVAAARIVSDVTIADTVRHLLVEVSFSDGGDPHVYQVPVVGRPERVSGHDAFLIGELDGRFVYDALHDSEGTDALLASLAEGRTAGPLRFTSDTDEQLLGLPGLALGHEQSNTSIVYGGEAILKVFRRVSPGTNPDLELTRALAAAGSSTVPRPLAWFETGSIEGGSIDGDTGGLDGRGSGATTLGLLQEFFRTGVDGWRLAVASVRDLYAEGDLHADEVGGDFAGEALRLGRATAEVHVLLRQHLASRPIRSDEWVEVSRAMLSRLDEAVAAVPELAPYEDGLRAAYGELRGVVAAPGGTGGTVAQRIHGDYHLGQVLRTEAGWVLLDFEGEPARPLAERTALMSPLRDVAGMLRSFDYAARSLLADQSDGRSLEYRAEEWATRNRSAFCDGYARLSGIDPRDESVLLRAFELDKAVYEVMYEARNRPSWLSIPLSSIERLVG